MGLMVLASELFMMMINVCAAEKGRGGGEGGVQAFVCVYDDDEWRSPSARTPNVCCVQT